jgi:predicted transcriptional regulator
MPDHFSLIRQQTAHWLKASGYHQNELAPELNWSESFLSEFMSGKSGLGGLKLCQLTAVVSRPPKTQQTQQGRPDLRHSIDGQDR